MKQIRIGMVLVLTFAMVAWIAATAIAKDKPSKNPQAPAFSEKDIFGKDTITLSSYQGKVVLLNFWATWCPPCRLEIPDIIELSKKYKDQLVVIGVSVDQDRSPVAPFVKQNKMNYPVIYGTDQIITDFGGISAIPTSFIIDTRGKIVQKIVGYRNYAAFEAAVKPYLNKVQK